MNEPFLFNPELHAEQDLDPAKVGVVEDAEVSDPMAELIELQKTFIEQKRDLFEMFSKNAGVKIEPGTGFKIIFDKPIRIELDAADWEKMQSGEFTEEEMLWSSFHELAHFLDMQDDPEGMRSHFDQMKEKAKTLTPKARRIWQQSLEEKGESLPSEFTDAQLEQFLYKQIHTLYNCLDDVYVNNIVAHRVAGRYLPGRGTKAPTVERLYRDHLFEEGDLATRPKSRQLGYAALRRHMVRDQVTKIDPDVEAILQQRILVGGKTMTRAELLKTLLYPVTKTARIQNTPSYRYKMIGQFIEPQFWSLFFEDIKNFPPPKVEQPPTGGQPGPPGTQQQPPIPGNEPPPEGPGIPQNQPGKDPDDEEGKQPGAGGDLKPNKDPWDDINSPNPIDPKLIDEFLQGKKEYQEAHRPTVEKPLEPKLSPIEAIKQAEIQHDATLAEAHGKLNPERARQIAADWHKYRESVKPYIEELTEVFDTILNTIDAKIIEAWQTGFKSGRLDIQHFIRTYGAPLAAGIEEGRIGEFVNFRELTSYAQQEFEHRLTIYPNDIVIRLILDNSGSMSGERIEAVKQLVVLFYESLKSFEARVNHRFRLKDPFQVQFQVQTFGSTTTLAKGIGAFGSEERGQMLATLGYLNAGQGGTADAQSWQNVTSELGQNPERAKKIRDGKAKDLTFEITDGDTETSEATQQALKEYMGYAGEGSAVALKITNLNETDEQYAASVFNTTFLGNGRRIDHPSKLAPVIAELLEQHLGKIREKLQVLPDIDESLD